tara:strand:- start:8630 stop:9046 length:417 start_codon:yes stop_codon:yes gene_type:complete
MAARSLTPSPSRVALDATARPRPRLAVTPRAVPRDAVDDDVTANARARITRIIVDIDRTHASHSARRHSSSIHPRVRLNPPSLDGSRLPSMSMSIRSARDDDARSTVGERAVRSRGVETRSFARRDRRRDRRRHRARR